MTFSASLGERGMPLKEESMLSRTNPAFQKGRDVPRVRSATLPLPDNGVFYEFLS